jgi:hypothetical protein
MILLFAVAYGNVFASQSSSDEALSQKTGSGSGTSEKSEAEGDDATADEEAPPSFRPGAEVRILLEVLAPKQWKINHMVPLRLEFEEEYLKEAPFAVRQPVWDFKLEHYAPSLTAEIPVKLSEDLLDGLVVVPLALACSICNEVGDSCAFVMENVSVKVRVLADAPPDTENQALVKGSLPASHLLSAP